MISNTKFSTDEGVNELITAKAKELKITEQELWSQIPENTQAITNLMPNFVITYINKMTVQPQQNEIINNQLEDDPIRNIKQYKATLQKFLTNEEAVDIITQKLNKLNIKPEYLGVNIEDKTINSTILADFVTHKQDKFSQFINDLELVGIIKEELH
jgi:hypothetical protein